MPFRISHADFLQAYQSSLRQSEKLYWGQHKPNLISHSKATSNLLPCSLWPELWGADKQRKQERKRQHLSLKIEPRRFAPARASSSKLCCFFCHSSLAQLLGDRVLLVKARASAQWPRGAHQEVRHQNQCSLRHTRQRKVLSCQYMLGEARLPSLTPGFSYSCLLLNIWDLRNICGSTALTYRRRKQSILCLTWSEEYMACSLLVSWFSPNCRKK